MNTFLLLTGAITISLAANTDGSSPSSPTPNPPTEVRSENAPASTAQERPAKARSSKTDSPADAPRKPRSDDTFRFEIAENSAAETTVGTVRVEAADGASVGYQIVSGNTSGAFAIDSKTGRLTVKNSSALDHEATPRFKLTVQATVHRQKDATIRNSFEAQLLDAGFDRNTVGELLDKRLTLTVHVDIKDVNEPPTASPGVVELDENPADGAHVVKVRATDPDRDDQLNYVILDGNTGNAFAIDEKTGAITVADPTVLDFEAHPQFHLRVQVTDSQGRTATETIEIRLQDANEPPRLDDQSLQLADEIASGTVVGTIAAHDPDAHDELRYEIVSGNESHAFGVAPETGQITVVDPDALRSEAENVELLIRVSDTQGAHATGRIRIANPLAGAPLPSSAAGTSSDERSSQVPASSPGTGPAAAHDDGGEAQRDASSGGTESSKRSSVLPYGLSFGLLSTLMWVTWKWRRTVSEVHRLRSLLKLERRTLSKEIEELNQECDRLLEANEQLAAEIKKTADMRRQMDSEQKKLGELRERLAAESDENAALKQELDQQSVQLQSDRDALYEIQLRLQLQHAELLQERQMLDAERLSGTAQPAESRTFAVISSPPCESAPSFNAVSVDIAGEGPLEFHEECCDVNVLPSNTTAVYVAGDDCDCGTIPAFDEVSDEEAGTTQPNREERFSPSALDRLPPEPKSDRDAEARALRAQLEELFGIAADQGAASSAESDGLSQPSHPPASPTFPPTDWDDSELSPDAHWQNDSTDGSHRPLIAEPQTRLALPAHPEPAPRSQTSDEVPFGLIEELVREADEADRFPDDGSKQPEECQVSTAVREEEEACDVNTYMEQLLGRVRRNTKGWQAPPEASPPETTSTTHLEAEAAASVPDQEEAEELEELDASEAVTYSPVLAHPQEPPPPVHRQDKNIVLESTESLREIANVAARSAVSRYTTRTKRRKSAVAWALATASFGLAGALLSGSLGQSATMQTCGWVSAAIGFVMIVRLVWLSATARKKHSQPRLRPTLPARRVLAD